MRKDTLDCLQIREPLQVGNLGTIFWSKSYGSGVSMDDWGNPIPGSKAVQHYSFPTGKFHDFSLDIDLLSPLRTSDGYDHIYIMIDWMMRQISYSYTKDGSQNVGIDDLAIPKFLINYMKKKLVGWGGTRLIMYNFREPEDIFTPLKITIEAGGGTKMPIDPDSALTTFASELLNVWKREAA